jgi:N-acetylglucosamine kinase-like BadF-type ATPase
MARAVFEYIGGPDWSLSRQFIYAQERGEVGKLALAVAASAGKDPAAEAILREAGRELARLAQALANRFGPRPVALAGRASDLHPIIAESMRAELPSGTALAQTGSKAHLAAARLAASPVPNHPSTH